MRTPREPRASGAARTLVLAIALLAAVAAGAWWTWGRGEAGGGEGAGRDGSIDDRPSPKAPRLPPPASRFLNANPGVAFVGSEACAPCHADIAAHHGTTPHGQSFGVVEPSAEPTPGAFWHEATTLGYETYVRDGQLRMRETLALGDDEPIVLDDHELRYFIGSKAHTRSYAIAADEDVLCEAPVTWYRSLERWAMSPGYDRPVHYNASRVLGRECLVCHVGRVEALGGSSHRVRIHENAIGCESCHGAGALHVERYATEQERTGAFDPTIVNPRHLEREESLDLCGRCHRPAPLNIDLPDRDVFDWRPGLRLNLFRIRYRREVLEKGMSLEGHPDQLRASVCFQESGTMTCVTCHDAHERPAPEDRAVYYRKKCETCHGDDACGTDPSHHAPGVDMDDCIACHMPASGTDIPHVSFRHHRIGIHAKSDEPKGPRRDPKLVAVDDDSHLSEDMRTRNLALAYHKFAVGAAPEEAHPAMMKARVLLTRLRQEGNQDPSAMVALATTLDDRSEAAALAGKALEADAPPELRFRIAAHEVLLRDLYARRDAEGLMAHLDALEAIRRVPPDWMLRAEVYRNLEKREEARATIERALSMQPGSAEVQHLAAEIFAWIGDEERAQRHGRIFKGLVERTGRNRAK